jgi:hypothetical protein
MPFKRSALRRVLTVIHRRRTRLRLLYGTYIIKRNRGCKARRLAGTGWLVLDKELEVSGYEGFDSGYRIETSVDLIDLV